jgi:hypothetical protein
MKAPPAGCFNKAPPGGAINMQALARIGSTKQTHITLCMARYGLPIYFFFDTRTLPHSHCISNGNTLLEFNGSKQQDQKRKSGRLPTTEAPPRMPTPSWSGRHGAMEFEGPPDAGCVRTRKMTDQCPLIEAFISRPLPFGP